jgi:hypothetical protein
MKPIQPTQKPFELGDPVIVDTGHTGFVTAMEGDKFTVCEAVDGTGWTMEVEERRLAHVRRLMRHDFTDDEIAELWAKHRLPRAKRAKMILFARSLLHGRPKK